MTHICSSRSSSDSFYAKFGARKLVHTFFHTFSSALYNIFEIFNSSQTSSHVNSFSLIPWFHFRSFHSLPYFISPHLITSTSFSSLLRLSSCYLRSSVRSTDSLCNILSVILDHLLPIFFPFYYYSRFSSTNHFYYHFLSFFPLHFPQLT